MLRGGLAILVQLYGVLTIVGVFGMLWRDTLGLLWAPDLLSTVYHLALGILAGLLLVALSRFAENHFESVAKLTRGFADMLGSFSVRDSLVVALASSIGEEIFFRGFLQGWLGIWWASALFALLHIGPDRRFASWPILAFMASLIFGGLLEHTGTVLAPIVAHGLVNFVNLRHIQSSNDGMDSESPR